VKLHELQFKIKWSVLGERVRGEEKVLLLLKLPNVNMHSGFFTKPFSTLYFQFHLNHQFSRFYNLDSIQLRQPLITNQVESLN
jgi:hypothetical protein